MNNILKLSLKKAPFDVMLISEKTNEYRKPSKWILSRLYNKDGSLKKYDYIEFTNGYGSDKPSFLTQYKGFDILSVGLYVEAFSNGLDLGFLPIGTIVINLGKIVSSKNINKQISMI